MALCALPQQLPYPVCCLSMTLASCREVIESPGLGRLCHGGLSLSEPLTRLLWKLRRGPLLTFVEVGVKLKVESLRPPSLHPKNGRPNIASWCASLGFQQRDSFHLLWVAVGEELDIFLSRARALLCPTHEACSLLAPDPQPEGTWLTLLLVRDWWTQRGLNAVLVCGPGNADEAYVVLSQHGVTIPDILCPTTDSLTHRVDVYNTGPEIDTMDAIPAGTMLYVQRAGVAVPTFPSVRSVLSDTSLDCGSALVPRPAEALHNRFVLLDRGFGQQILDLQQGPVLPQVSALVGLDTSVLRVWFQREQEGTLGNFSVYGSTLRRCLAYRCLAESPSLDGNMYFLDVRGLGLPICPLPYECQSLHGDHFLASVDFELPRGFCGLLTSLGVP